MGFFLFCLSFNTLVCLPFKEPDKLLVEPFRIAQEWRQVVFYEPFHVWGGHSWGTIPVNFLEKDVHNLQVAFQLFYVFLSEQGYFEIFDLFLKLKDTRE